MSKEKIKVYLYTRVSTAMQIDGYSLEAQKTKMKAFCDYNEYEIAGEYEDAGKSGKSIEGNIESIRYLKENATGIREMDGIGDDMELENNDDKFNIEKTDTIDSLAYEQDTSSLILLLADGMDWSDMNRHLLLLQDKLNTYIWYIDSGQYKEKYPNVKSVELRVSFLFEEPAICHKLLERAKQVFIDVFENVEMIVEHGTK